MAIPLADISVRVEPWGDFWRDGQAIMQEEFDEYKDELKLWKPFALDYENLTAIARANGLVIVCGRVNGVLGGYLWWSFEPDLEAKPHMLYRQGPFYISRRFRRYSLGLRMFRVSLRLIRAHISSDVELDLHCPPVGRGKRLASYFGHLGAVEVARHYRLRVSPSVVESSHA